MLDHTQDRLIPGMGDYTDDGSEGIDEEAIERDWVANCCPQEMIQAARRVIEDTDYDTEGEDFECVELRNTILRFIEDVENLTSR